MAHRQTNLAGPKPIPTLEDAYELIMDKFTSIIHFIQRHMTVGHLLEDPLEEARELRNKMDRQVLLFDCLWQSKPDEARVEDLREWVAIVKNNAKTKLKALELIMLLQEKRQHGVKTHNTKFLKYDANEAY